MRRVYAVAALFLAFAGSSARGGVLPPGYHFLSGNVVLREPIVVPKGSVLYVAPGTEVRVALEGYGGGGDVPQVLIVAGKLLVDGRPEDPVRFIGEKPWGEIYLGGATAVVTHTEVSNAAWAFHVHRSTALFEALLVRDSYGGIRSNGSGVYLYDSEIRNCEIALRYLNGGPVVRGSRLVGNRVGVFFREGVSSAVFRDNVILSTEYVLKIGDFAEGFVDVRENYWGVDDVSLLREKVFDGRDVPFDWSVFSPILTEPPLAGVGAGR